MTHGSPWRLIVSFAVPVLLSQIFQQLYNTADTLIVGRFLGDGALAAVSSSGPLIFLLISFFEGLTMGASVTISRYFGAGAHDRVQRAIHTNILVSTCSGIFLTGFGIIMTPQILRWMGTDPEVLPDAISYFRYYFTGVLAVVLYNACKSIMNALGDSRRPLYYLMLSSAINIVLDIVLVVGLGMGVAGAAWATILSQFLSAVFSTVVRLRNFPILHLRREDFHDLKGAAVLHLKTGFPMGFQMSVMCIGQLAMQAVVNSLGTAAVAGYTAASKADQLSVLVNNAMMTAISNYVAQNFGAGKKDRIRLGVRASLIQTEAFNILMCIGILLLRHPIVELFLSNPTAEIYHYSDAFLTIEAPFYFLLGLLAVYRTSIQSMQNGRAPFTACMIELVMRLAATVWLSRFLGYTAVCIASPLAWFGAIALLIPVYYRMMMKPVKTV